MHNKRVTIFWFMVPLFLLFLSKTGFTQTWGPAANLGPNINTSSLEDGHCITRDSSKLYVATDRAGGLGGGDIWVSEYIGGWQVPVNLGSNVNSFDEEYEPCISSDGLKLYFSSFRSGGYGQSDIYVSENIGGTWQPAVNVGPIINSADYEGFPFVSSDGSKLYFTSDRAGGYGFFDIWFSVAMGDSWGPPVNLGSVINTSDIELGASLSYDGQILCFASDRSGGYGSIDIWQSENVGGVWQPPTNLGSNINTSSDELAPIVSSNGRKLYFAAYEWPGGYGSYDIWVSEYQGAVEEQTTHTMNNHWLQTIVSGPLQLPHDKKCVFFDICGRKVDPLNLTPGVYFVQVQDQNLSRIEKVVKLK